MSKNFDFKNVESRWKEKWYDSDLYAAEDFSDKPKKYILAEFPYPSGKSMHLGHMMRFTMPDVYSRYLRMKGFNVMFPLGWDAFGLPAENYAIKTGNHPADLIDELSDAYRDVMQSVGYSVDWDREINTTDPSYYKWTQWIFLKFYEAGLAELREEPVWWSEKMKTVLAEEEVEKDEEGNLVAERDGSPVVRKMVKQWVLKMPEYADKLIDGLEDTEFPDSIKSAQKNWIDRKEGLNITYPIKDESEEITVFTTRPDTNFGATFVVLAPEHPIVKAIMEGEVEVSDEVQGKVTEYVKDAQSKSELDRISEVKHKSGVNTGLKVINPLNDYEMELWVADYVLMNFGTGAVVGVPAHDVRDFEFAEKFGIEIIPVISADGKPTDAPNNTEEVFTDLGIVFNSDFLDGYEGDEAIEKVSDYIEEKGFGERKVTYRLRDWIFSRQRYWGEPVPMVHYEDGSTKPIVDVENDPEGVHEKLPLELPEVPDYSPNDEGTSPIAANEEWVNTEDEDGNPVQRDVNTMPNWAGSCWYYMRYIDPNNDEAFADFEKLKYWLPVDHYFGGSEHTTLHLLYSRFWHKFLYDKGVVPTPEPYKKRTNGGILLGPDGTKMSKSKGNVIEPQEKFDKYGADAVRCYVMFMGPYNGTLRYSEASLQRCHKLVNDVYEMRKKVDDSYENPEIASEFHRMLERVTDMAENMKFNTVVSDFMVFTNMLMEEEKIPGDIWSQFIVVTAPIMPFLAEELWYDYNGYEEWSVENSVHKQEWPEFDPELAKKDIIEVPVQVNGDLRGTIEVSPEISEADIREIVEADEAIMEYVEGDIKKFIYVPGKIVNIVC